MANTYKLIASSTVGSGGANSIDFTSIPSTYTDLLVKLSAREADNSWILNMSFNNTTANRTYRMLLGNGSAASSSNASGIIVNAVSTNGTASTFSNVEIYIPNYTSSNYKSISIDGVSESNQTTAYSSLIAGLWSDTSAINRITFAPSTTTILEYSTFYLYGIKNS